MNSLLNIIPELYNDKIEYDTKHELDDFKIQFDEYFYLYMNDKFKHKKIVNKNCEETIYSIMKYSIDDKRVDLNRRFLGIGDDRLRREVLDIYFILLKSRKIYLTKINYNFRFTNIYL